MGHSLTLHPPRCMLHRWYKKSVRLSWAEQIVVAWYWQYSPANGMPFPVWAELQSQTASPLLSASPTQAPPLKQCLSPQGTLSISHLTKKKKQTKEQDAHMSLLLLEAELDVGNAIKDA